MSLLRIATRKSPLALWQAEFVAAELKKNHRGLTIELVPMSTKGDRILDSPLAKIGGKGLFVKELEQGLLENKADLAVHSMKDVPVDFPPGLALAAVLARDDPRDAFVANNWHDIDALPLQARVGTSSLRRQCQLRAYRPDLNIIDLRGNVNSRLAKLDVGDYDAIILAAAGLQRMGWAKRITQLLPPEKSLPAIGQGILGIETRIDDNTTNQLIQPLHDHDSHIRITAERALNRRLCGSCQVPIAGFAELLGATLKLRGLVGDPDGSKIIRATIDGSPNDGRQLGYDLAETLLSQGADKILAALGLAP